MQAASAQLAAAEAQSQTMQATIFPSDAARRQATAGFGAIGRFCRGVSSILGGLLLGSSFGLIPGIAGGFVGAVVFTFAENSIRR